MEGAYVIKPQFKYTKAMIGVTVQPTAKQELIVEPMVSGTIEPCTACHGLNDHNQVRGTGQMPCPNCYGTGKDRGYADTNCKLCQGDGEIECLRCHGQGEIEKSTLITKA